MPNNIEGLEEVLANVEALGNPRKAKSAARKAARKAMNIVKKEAVKNAKTLDDKDTELKLWKQITVKAKKSKNKGEVIMSVGMKGGAKESNAATYYWRFLEFGTIYSPAKPFLRPAMYNSLQDIDKEFKEVFNENIMKELSR